MKKFLHAAGGCLYAIGICTFALFCVYLCVKYFIFKEKPAHNLPLQTAEAAGEIARKSVEFSEHGWGLHDCGLLRVYKVSRGFGSACDLKNFDEIDEDAARIWRYIQKNRALFAPEFDLEDVSACKAAYKLRSWQSGLDPHEADFLLYDERGGKCYHFEFNGGAGGFK